MGEQFENTYSTTLDGAIDDNDTTLTVGTPPDMTGQFRIKIDDEIIIVGAVSGNDFTGCTRGAEGTVAASHSSGVEVRHVLTAGALNNLKSDPLAEIFPAPTTTFEFDTTSLTGLTALGSPDTENADSTIPGHLYYVDLNGAYSWVGRYLTAPSAPFTAITLVRTIPFSNFNSAGIFIGESPPGNADWFYIGENGGTKLALDRATPTAFSSNISNQGYGSPHGYLAIRVNSSSNVDYSYSQDGYIWRNRQTARNPSITIGTVGIAVKAENGTHPAGAAFDFLRIWDSALTFPGL